MNVSRLCGGAHTFFLQAKKVCKKARGCVYCFKGSSMDWLVLIAINNAERSGTEGLLVWILYDA